MQCLKITPHTKKLGDEFKDCKIINLVDHIPFPRSIILDQDTFFKNSIIDLFTEANIDYHDKTFVINDYICFDDFDQIETIYLNKFFIEECAIFLARFPNWTKIPQYKVLKKASAMMNKTRPNRELLSLVLGNLFDSADILYSSGSTNKIAIKEYINNTNYTYDIEKVLEEKWLGSGNRIICNLGVRYPDNSISFETILFNELFKNTAVSLITESIVFENGFMFTEKTIMSIYSGHFMIWVGGWRSAESAKKLGLDIFDDIIDHSYQYIKHPGERAVEAVLRNFNLINDIKLQEHLRDKHQDRLNHNLQLVRNINELKKTTIEQFNDVDLYNRIVTNNDKYT